jgi:hypothetical protein
MKTSIQSRQKKLFWLKYKEEIRNFSVSMRIFTGRRMEHHQTKFKIKLLDERKIIFRP